MTSFEMTCHLKCIFLAEFMGTVALKIKLKIATEKKNNNGDL